ncbi:MAG: hypothetical protein GY782_08845 [Gammaproteobacteria bacterium]|nr:hypothetical protein [Gammaproteobacteria bacterium]
MGVEIYINTARFIKILTNEVAFEVARQVESFAKRRVAVDSGDLKGTITIAGIMPGEYKVFSMSPYGLAQEYGLASFGKPNYRYQPYMRPAAAHAGAPGNINKAVNKAVRRAISGSKV